MAVLTQQIRAHYPASVVGYMPDEIVKAIGEDELLDRLTEATRLHKRAFDPATPRELTTGYLDRARAVCAAQPRDVTEAQAGAWVAKAQSAATNVHAAACLDRARQIRDENPQAPVVLRVHVSPEEVRRRRDEALLKADIARAAAAERAKKAEEERHYREALAGRETWTYGDQLRFNRENPAA